jgi:hypothetical protein
VTLGRVIQPGVEITPVLPTYFYVTGIDDSRTAIAAKQTVAVNMYVQLRKGYVKSVHGVGTDG